jgi:hypothetical protein
MKGCPIQPRAWKSTDAAAAAKDFFRRCRKPQARKAAVRELISELCSDDPFDHRCAAEFARLVSRREPGILAAYGDVIVAAAHNATTRPQRMRLLPLVRTRLAEDRTAVRAMALEALAILAAHEPELRDEAMEMLEEARHNSEPAMRARARLMLPIMLKAESQSR